MLKFYQYGFYCDVDGSDLFLTKIGFDDRFHQCMNMIIFTAIIIILLFFRWRSPFGCHIGDITSMQPGATRLLWMKAKKLGAIQRAKASFVWKVVLLYCWFPSSGMSVQTSVQLTIGNMANELFNSASRTQQESDLVLKAAAG